MQIKHVLNFLAYEFLLFAAMVPFANAVIISPVQIDLSVKNPVGSFTVTNDSAVMLTYQSGGYSWAQIDGQDVQINTNDLVVTPPIISIKPRSSQVFRVGLFKPGLGLIEQSYRIILDDISAEVTEKSENGINFRFNHNLPVFYAPLKIIDSMVWSMCETQLPGKSCVQMENKGNRHVKIIQFTTASSTMEEHGNISKTLLAGSSSQWLFSTMLGSENAITIKLVTNRGHLNLNLSDLPGHK